MVETFEEKTVREAVVDGLRGVIFNVTLEESSLKERREEILDLEDRAKMSRLIDVQFWNLIRLEEVMDFLTEEEERMKKESKARTVVEQQSKAEIVKEAVLHSLEQRLADVNHRLHIANVERERLSGRETVLHELRLDIMREIEGENEEL